jgi:cytochrome c
MSGFELNKLIASLLFAGIVCMLTGMLSETLYESINPIHNDKRGYSIAVLEEKSDGDGASAPKEPEVDFIALFKTASADNGKAVFQKCSACHTYEKDGINKIGPNLWNIINRQKASHAGYNYSKALSALSSNKWGFKELIGFLKAPQKYLPGTKMSFAGLKNPKDIVDVIEFLRLNASESSVEIPSKLE